MGERSYLSKYKNLSSYIFVSLNMSLVAAHFFPVRSRRTSKKTLLYFVQTKKKKIKCVGFFCDWGELGYILCLWAKLS